MTGPSIRGARTPTEPPGSPAASAKRPAGSGTRHVAGPGSRASAAARVRRVDGRQGLLEQRRRVDEHLARLRARPPLQRVERRDPLGAVERRGEPVDRVGRDERQAAGVERGARGPPPGRPPSPEPPAHGAGDPGQVVARGRPPPGAGVAQHRLHGGRLAGARPPSAASRRGGGARARPRDDPGDRLQARGPGDEGLARLARQLRRRGRQVGLAEVRRVGDHGVEARGRPARRSRRTAASSTSAPAAAALAPAAASASGERSTAVTRRPVPLGRQGDRDRPAAGAPVEHGRARGGAPRAPTPPAVSVSGRGTSTPGPTRSRSRRKARSPVRYATGSRRPRRATGRGHGASSGWRQRPLGVGVEPQPLHPERVRQQQLGVEAGRRGAALGQEVAAAPQDLARS